MLRDDLGGTGEGPPVVWSDAQGIHFLRPSRGERDANAVDLVTLASGPYRTRAEGRRAARAADPGRRRCAPDPVSAWTSALRSSAACRSVLAWSTSGTSTAPARCAQPTSRIASAQPGSYLVLLNVVRGDGTSIGSPATVRVHVVRRARARAPAAPPAGLASLATAVPVPVPAAAVTRARADPPASGFGASRQRRRAAYVASARQRRRPPPRAPVPAPADGRHAPRADREATSSAVP